MALIECTSCCRGFVFLTIWAVNRIEWAITMNRDSGFFSRDDFLNGEHLFSFFPNNFYYFVRVIGISLYLGLKGNEMTVKNA